MKHKILIRQKLHEQEKSHDMIIGEIVSPKTDLPKLPKFKIVYEAYNAAERLTVSLFNGTELKPIFGLQDLGELPQKSAYNLLNPKQREDRANNLFKKAITHLKLLLS